MRGLGGDDVIGTSAGFDTLTGGPGADKFVIRLENGQTDAAVDRVADFQYAFGDKIGLAEALDGIAFTNIADVVRATPVSGGPAPFSNGTMIAVNRGAGFEDALFLAGVSFTTGQLQSYGFELPPAGAAAFVENPYGFTNTSNTAEDPQITPDGRYVAWVDKQNIDGLTGDFTPLTPVGEDAASRDVFVRNMATFAVQRVSVDENGAALVAPPGQSRVNSISPAVTPDGRFVAFVTNGRATSADANSTGDVYLRDLLLDTAPVLISRSTGSDAAAGGVPVMTAFQHVSVSLADISDDGRRIAFVTSAPLAGNDFNGQRDIYLRDLDANGGEGATTLVSVGPSGFAGGAVPDPYSGGYYGDIVHISANGRYVAYVTQTRHQSDSAGQSNLPSDNDGNFDIYLRDTQLGRTLLVSTVGASDVTDFDMSADASRIVFSTRDAVDRNDLNQLLDVYLAEIDLAAWSAPNISGQPQSAFVEFRRLSEAAGGIELVGDLDGGSGGSFAPAISPDGTRVAFLSTMRDIVPIDPAFPLPSETRLFEVDLTTGALRAAPAPFSPDNAEGPTQIKGFDLSNDLIAVRTGGFGDSIAVGGSAAIATPDIAGDGSDNVALRDVFTGVTTIRGAISPFRGGTADVDVYQLTSSGAGLKVVSLEGVDSGGGTLASPAFTIRSGSQTGPVVATGGDNGIGRDAYAEFNYSFAVEPYFIIVSGASFSSGSYRLRFDEARPAPGSQTPVILAQDDATTDNLSSVNETDWFRFDTADVASGDRFRINLSPTGGNPLSTAIIRVYDADGDVREQAAAGVNTLAFNGFSGDQAADLGFIEIATSGDTGAYTVTLTTENRPLVVINPIPTFDFDFFG